MNEVRISLSGPDVKLDEVRAELKTFEERVPWREGSNGQVHSVAGDPIFYVSILLDITKDIGVSLFASYLFEKLRTKNVQELKIRGKPVPHESSVAAIEEALRDLD